MAAGAAAGPELCPHCRRPFRRLRQHLPHCKAAPPPAPGTSPRAAPASASRAGPSPGPRPAPGGERGSGVRPTPAGAPGSAPRKSPRPAPASAPGPSPGPRPAAGSAPGPSPAPRPRRAPGSGSGSVPAGPGQPREAAVTGGPAGSGGSAEPAVQDVARSLDLHPEEVEDVPERLEKGAKVVIEQHRARVVREKEPRSGAGAAGSRGAPGEGPDPGPAPQTQRRKTAPKPKRKETRSQGAVGNGTGSSEGEKSSLKATKVLQELSEHKNGHGDLVQQEGRDKSAAGEERVHLEAGVGSKAPECASHPKKLHLSVTGALGQGTATKGPRDSREQVAAASEPVLSSGRAPGLALLHSPAFHPTCPSRASGRSSWAAATGLEWFPALYPDDEGLRIFPGQRFQGDVELAVVAPKGCLSEGQRGPLWERPLLEVRLGELHSWIRTCNFSPQGLLGAVQKAWSSYCAKYIHVRQGGPAGISMLLAGYCLLSYGWNYQHLKQHRWRKYH